MAKQIIVDFITVLPSLPEEQVEKNVIFPIIAMGRDIQHAFSQLVFWGAAASPATWGPETVQLRWAGFHMLHGILPPKP